jgi:hypothetical protein
MPRRLPRLLLATFIACGLAAFLLSSWPLHADESPAVSAASEDSPTPGRDKLIAALEKTLTNSSLVGHYTTVGEQETPAEERYDLGKVKHLEKDQWSIEVRIRYGEHDTQVPIVVPIRWAKDTPIISVDDLAIPALGTYTARVMVYRDHYAGFWTGHGHGGHLYGLVKHEVEQKEKKADADKKSGATRD